MPETFAMAFRNVYTFGPTFRAENSNTARHAAEFWMLEPEIAFADLSDVMALAEDMMKYVIRAALERLPEEMAFFNQYVDKGLLERLQHICPLILAVLLIRKPLPFCSRRMWRLPIRFPGALICRLSMNAT